MNTEEERKNRVKDDSEVFVHLKGWGCHYLSGENCSRWDLVGQGRSDQEFGFGRVKSSTGVHLALGDWSLESREVHCGVTILELWEWR